MNACNTKVSEWKLKQVGTYFRLGTYVENKFWLFKVILLGCSLDPTKNRAIDSHGCLVV